MRTATFDALRGAAILAVVQLHYVVITGGAAFLHFPGTAKRVLAYGWAGVDLFFVLSAYLLTRRLLQSSQPAHPVLSFYRRRAARILPLYLVLLLAGFALAAVAPATAAASWLFRGSCPSWSYPVLLQNWCYGWAGGSDAHFWAPTWSLAVEEHFYIVLPLLAALGSPKGRIVACVGVIVAAPLLRAALAAAEGPAAAYYWSIARADAFAWGILLATAPRVWPTFYNQIRPTMALAAGLGLLVATAVVVPDVGGHDVLWGMTATALAAALLTYFAVSHRAPLGWVGHLLAWVDQRSYSIYLLHMPALGLTFAGLGGHAPRVETATDLALIGAALALSLALACGSFHIFERGFVSASRGREETAVSAAERLA